MTRQSRAVHNKDVPLSLENRLVSLWRPLKVFAIGLAIPLVAQVLPAAGECPSFGDFEARKAHLQNRIDQGLATGALTATQAERFHKKLARLDQEVSVCKESRCLNSWDSKNLSQEFSRLGSQITRALNAGKSQPLAATPATSN